MSNLNKLNVEFSGVKINTLELVKQINVFRAEIDGKSPLKHKHLLDIVRDEFEEEIVRAEISAVTYKTVRAQISALT